jgi:hypothetical protein
MQGGAAMTKPRIPEVAHLPVSFHAKKDHVVAIYYLKRSTIGIRFESPEQMLEFFNQLMEKAVLVWPDNEWIKEYLSD